MKRAFDCFGFDALFAGAAFSGAIYPGLDFALSYSTVSLKQMLLHGPAFEMRLPIEVESNITITANLRYLISLLAIAPYME